MTVNFINKGKQQNKRPHHTYPLRDKGSKNCYIIVIRLKNGSRETWTCLANIQYMHTVVEHVYIKIIQKALS